jgi:hypothetical protein
MASDHIAIDQLIERAGLGGSARAAARAALEAAGLTNPRKQYIATTKVEAAEAAFSIRFQRVCATCEPFVAEDGPERVRVEGACCERCGGSNNGRAARAMVTACKLARLNRIVFVGGSPSFRQEIKRLVGRQLQLRLVDGTTRVTKASAQADIAWADAVVVCGATELAHKVSTLYTRDPAARRKLIVTSRRGIEAIADAVTRSDLIRDRST